ncbi:MAG: magnesium transporter CorA family protein [Candidatus Magasanikbacteria bacterium]|nr:magnesium transporter CorA family protein [Candidatus Magasanikbacteria bacterium]
MDKSIQEIKNSTLTWAHIVAPNEKLSQEVGKRFGLHPLDVQDILPPLQRPKLEDRSQYLFLILLFPFYNRATKKISPIEVDIVIGKDFLLTFSSAPLFALDQLFREHAPSKKKKIPAQILPDSPSVLLYKVLSTLEHYCFPMITHISNDIDAVESNIFEVKKIENINEVLRIKTNIVNFRKAMNRHTRVIKQLIEKADKLFSVEELSLYFNDLVEHTEDIWGMLENFSDTIDAIHESHTSLLNLRSNQIMQRFTLFTSIIFSLTLVATILVARAPGTPFIDWPFGFLWIVIVMGIVGSGMFAFYKLRKWM